MGLLRTRLAESSPELHAALERSWKTATEEWLPAVDSRGSSFNSYPHLRNIESHLDQVLASLEALPDARDGARLRPVEIYVLLASVLFHDLGRAHKGDGREHAVHSREYILGKYGNLGIPSPELAKCIAEVSLGHDAPGPWRPASLYDVVIDPYGNVRLRALWALLVLGDHMDGANTRAFPPYLQDSAEMGPVGLFRRSIRGVFADCESQMVRVVVSDMKPWRDKQQQDGGGKGSECRYDVEYEFAPEKELRRCDLDHTLLAEIERSNHPDRPKDERRKWTSDSLVDVADPRPSKWKNIREKLRQWLAGSHSNPAPSSGIWELLDDLPPDALPIDAELTQGSNDLGRSRKLQLPDWLTAIGILRGRLVRKPDRGGDGAPAKDADPWPHPVLVAVLLHDTQVNFDALKIARSDLAVLGVPLRSWLLEHREHLYNRYGWEVFEPIFDHHSLRRIAKAMWELSLAVFGSSRFTYDELAAEAREPNVTRAQLAVLRLSILERCELYETEESTDCCGNAIWAGESRWCWEKRRQSDLLRRCEACNRKTRECWRHTLLESAVDGLDYINNLIDRTQSPTR